MSKLHSVQITLNNTKKEISVFCDDVTTFNEPIDVLTTSAFVGDYSPIPGTIFNALFSKGINVQDISKTPAFDLRTPCNIWLSQELSRNACQTGRIGCIELIGHHLLNLNSNEAEQAMINSIRAYFRMLDIASLYNVKINTIALPLLGTGSQSLPNQMLLTPLINECLTFLKRNDEIKKIYFIQRNPMKAELIANALKNSFRFINNQDAETKDQKKKRLRLSVMHLLTKTLLTICVSDWKARESRFGMPLAM